MLRRALASLAVCFAVASAAAAAEFVPGFDAFSAWESNVFATNQNEHSDFSGLVGPNVELRQENGAVQYDIHYRMHYEAYATLKGINDFQHFLDATGSWDISPTTKLSLSDTFTQASSAQQLFSSTTAANGLVQVGEENTRREIQTNDALVTLVQHLTPRWQLQTSFEHLLYNYPKNNALQVPQFSSTSMAGNVQLMHALTPRLAAGFGTGVTRQDFEEQNGVGGRGATIYRGFGVFNYQITPTLTLSFSGGPALNDPDSINNTTNRFIVQKFPTNQGFVILDPSSCPVDRAGRHVFNPLDPGKCGPQSGTALVGLPNLQTGRFFLPETQVGFDEGTTTSQVSTSLTYYGRISLDKQWETVWAGIEYDRSASTASGLGASTNLDALSGYVRWTPTQAWSLQWSVGAYRQTSASKVQQVEFVVEPSDRANSVFVLEPGASIPSLKDGIAQTVGLTSRLVNSGLEFITYTAGFNASRRVSKHLTLLGSVNWWQQETKGDFKVPGGATRQDVRIQLGFTWTFEPIQLPSLNSPL